MVKAARSFTLTNTLNEVKDYTSSLAKMRSSSVSGIIVRFSVHVYNKSLTIREVVEWLNQVSFNISALHKQSPGTLLFWLEDLISFRSMFSIDILVISPSLSLSSPEGRGSAMFLLISPRDRQALDTRVTFSSVAVLMMFTTGKTSMNIIMISSYPSPPPPPKKTPVTHPTVWWSLPPLWGQLNWVLLSSPLNTVQ